MSKMYPGPPLSSPPIPLSVLRLLLFPLSPPLSLLPLHPFSLHSPSLPFLLTLIFSVLIQILIVLLSLFLILFRCPFLPSLPNSCPSLPPFLPSSLLPPSYSLLPPSYSSLPPTPSSLPPTSSSLLLPPPSLLPPSYSLLLLPHLFPPSSALTTPSRCTLVGWDLNCQYSPSTHCSV